MSNKINLNDIDLENLNDNVDDIFFEKKEKITKILKSPEEKKYNNGHKKKTQRITKQL